MNSFHRPQGPVLMHVRGIFEEIEAAQTLLQPQEHRSTRMAASRLYAASRGGETSRELEAVLASSRAARAVYRRAVADGARFSLPEARAASSRHTAARHGEGCRIRIERSRAEPDQFYVVVELAKETPAAASPTSLIVCDSDDRCQRFPLPPVRDGIAQIIAEDGSDLMRLIGDPTTRVYLR
jgi:hypothetical protein